MDEVMDPSNDRVFEVAAELFALLSTPTRLRIVCELCAGEKNVSHLLARVGAHQSNVSQHLGTLFRSGILARRRAGTQVFYRISSQKVLLLCDALRAERGEVLVKSRNLHSVP